MRPSDWAPVGLATDPVPGDVVLVLAGGQEYLEVAGAIDRASRRMRSLESGGMVSEALEALAERRAETVDDVARAFDRYRETGEALVAYAGALREAQASSADALDMARVAAADAEEASRWRQYSVRLAEEAAKSADTMGHVGAAVEQAHYERQARRYEEDEVTASLVAAAARAAVDEATEVRDRAAQEAIGRIGEITVRDGLADTWWDDWGKEVLAVVADVAGWISTAAGVLALVVAWIPVVGQGLAGVLLLVAAVSAAINAIGNIVLASTGDRTVSEAVISIVGAALSCVGLGGVARVLGRVVTTRVLLGEAHSGVTEAGRMMGSGVVLERHAAEAVSAFRASHAWRLLRNEPGALWESSREWLRAVPVPSQGQRIYRVWGDDVAVGADALRSGGSFSPVDPRTLRHARSTLGLPSRPFDGYNPMTDPLVARVDDASAHLGRRHALPFDGNPGGAPELLFRGWDESGSLTPLSDLTWKVS